MMGVDIREARQMSYWEFTAMKAVWNARHRPEDEVAPPDGETMRKRMEQASWMFH